MPHPRLLLSLCLCLWPVLLSAEEPAFDEHRPEGFTVLVSRKAAKEQEEQTRKALELLEQQLYQARRVLPAESFKELQQVPIWLAADEDKLGIAFHPGRDWLTDRGYEPPDHPSLIGLVSGEFYLHESLRQPWLIFHELCHGYDWFYLGKQKTYGCSESAYRDAMDSGNYESALHWDGRLRQAYHASNRMEFFAECSEAFFGTNDIFPFVNAELRDLDPATYRLLGEVWKVDLKQRERQEKEIARFLETHSLISGLPGNETPLKSTGKQLPSEEYQTEQIQGWTVQVHPDLKQQEELRQGVLRQLDRDLHFVKRYVSTASLPMLQQTTIWIEANDPAVPWVAYHTSRDWLEQQGLNPDKTGGIEIGQPKRYLDWFPQQTSILQYLLSASYLQKAGLMEDPVLQRLLTSVQAEPRMQQVLRFDGDSVAHPARRNAWECFARLSMSRFGTGDHYPFVNAEVKKEFPELDKLLQELWTPPVKPE